MSLAPALRRARGRIGGWTPFGALIAVAVAACVLLVVYPLASMTWTILVEHGNPFTLARRVLGAPGMGRVLVNTAIVVLVSTTLALAVAATLAWLMERTNASLSWIGRLIPLLPLMVPPLVGSIGWVTLLAPRTGLLNVGIRDALAMVGIRLTEGPFDIYSWWGTIFLYTIFIVPFGYIVLESAFRNLDPSLEEAARVSGAGPVKVFCTVTLPSLRHALLGAWNMQLIIAFAMFAVPVTVSNPAGIEVLSVRIYRLLTFGYPPDVGSAVVLSALVLACVAGCAVAQRQVEKQRRHGQLGGRGARASRIDLGRMRGPARLLLLAYLCGTSLLPLAGMLIVSLQKFLAARVDWGDLTLANYRHVLADAEALDSLANSLWLGVQGGVLVMVLAVLIGLYLLHARGAGGHAVDLVSRLPAAVPPLVIAVALVAAFAGPPFSLGGTAPMLLIAYLIIHLPQASIASNTALAQVGDDLVAAARVFGAGGGVTFRRVVLPLIWPGVAAGFALCCVLIAGEVTASAILAGADTPVIGFTLVKMLERTPITLVSALGVLVVLVLTALTLAALWVGGLGSSRRTGRRPRSRLSLPRRPARLRAAHDNEPSRLAETMEIR